MNILNDNSALGAYTSTMSSSSGVNAQGEGKATPVVAKPLATLQASVDSVKPATVKTVAEQPSNQDLEKLMVDVNKKLSSLDNYMSFKKDEGSGRSVFTLIDSNSQEVIKQYPSEEFLQISTKLTEYLDEHSGQNSLPMSDKVGSLLSILA